MAALLTAEHNFCIYRRYNWLRNRLLLEQEIELAKLKEELMMRDEKLVKIDFSALMSKNTDPLWDEQVSQRQTLQTIKEKLKEYGEIMTPTVRIGD